MVASCEKKDDLAPVIQVLQDSVDVHYRTIPYNDPGVLVLDNHTCDIDELLTIDNNVDIWRYGSYEVIYTATDMSENTTQEIREVDIVLRPEDYYDLTYDATDICDGISFSYTGIIQDCDCDTLAVTVGNISNFGLSATFTLPLDGTYNEMILMDTTKAGVTFNGNGIISPGADTIVWSYTISTDSETNVCTSTWVK